MINLRVKPPIKLPVEKSILLHAAQLTLESQQDIPRSDMSIVIGDEALLKSLNQKYRQVDTSTDVLSFPANEPDPDTHTLYLGDVVVSLAKAQEQALLGGHPLVEELQLLVVHGTLHLLGFDHLSPADKKRMQARQDEILRQLGLELRVTL